VGCPEDSGQRTLVGFVERNLEIMGSKRTRFSVEFKTEAVRMVVDGPCPIAQVARELKMNSGTLGNWVDQYRAAHPVAEEPLTVSERVRLRELESEVRELRMKNEFLGKAAAFFARESQ
jgi:transposase